jgi:AP-1 complex subunit gamma-1
MPLLNFSFQAAVPKYLKLEILPPSSTTIPGNSNGAVTQEIRVTNSMQGEKPIMLKLKINYNYGGKPIEELGQAANIPPGF